MLIYWYTYMENFLYMDNFTKPFLINSKYWYNFNEIYKLYPELFYGCDINKNYVIKYLKDEDYILCIYENNEWKECKTDNSIIFISKDWIENNILNNLYYIKVKDLEHKIELIYERHEREKIEYQNKIDKEKIYRMELEKKYLDRLEKEKTEKKQLQFENKLNNKSKCIII